MSASRWWGLIAALVVTACGRFGYSPLDGDAGGVSDAATQGSDGGRFDAGSPAADASSLPDAPLALCTTPDCEQQTVSVTGDENDGTMRAGEWLQSGHMGGHVRMGRRGGENAWGYFRFRLGPAIPAGATVVEVRLQMVGSETAGWNASAHRLLVMVEDSADAPVITTYEERPDGTVPGFVRFPAAATAEWNPGGLAWPVIELQTTPDLAPLLQELVDRYGGLAAGAHVQLWIRGEGFITDATVGADDFAHADSIPASLTLAWTPP